ncbi:MAG: PIN domain-containing protein [Defluviitaleaceae bacterium]|nr:PIN domain-containing protein [Defluviitaleaceae bacterium]
MLLIDANAILRFILRDNEEMAQEVGMILKTRDVVLKNEVLAEVLYVMEGVYKLSRQEMCPTINGLIALSRLHMESKEVVAFALKTFEETRLDFVDTLLYAYHVIEGKDVFTFDKKLRNKLKTATFAKGDGN